jgi:hypothetical protein
VDDRDSDTRNFIGAILSGLFIVVLAVHTVLAWEETNAAEDHVLAEASAVADTYWNMGVAPEPQRARIRAGLLDYLSLVAGQEWPVLAEGKSPGAVDSLLIALRTEVARLPTTPDQVRAARDRGLDRIRDISDHRSARIDQSYGLSPIGHLTLVATFAGVVLAFPILVGFTASARHLVILALTAGVLAAPATSPRRSLSRTGVGSRWNRMRWCRSRSNSSGHHEPGPKDPGLVGRRRDRLTLAASRVRLSGVVRVECQSFQGISFRKPSLMA